MRGRSAWLAGSAVGACLLLAACGGADRTEASFAQPDYSYLPKLRLNVGTIAVEDHVAPAADPNELSQDAPVPPAQALRQMAGDRLLAAGTSGAGVFTIDQASITGTGGGALDGHLSAHLDILTANGGHAGYAEAHVSRQFVPGGGTSDGGTRAQLYQLTTQMMQDMNVELEYQVRRSLRDWLVDASGAPIAGSVEQQTLAPPGADASPAAAPGGTPVGTAPVGATPVGATPVGSTPVGATPFGVPPTAQGAAPIQLAPDVSAAPPQAPVPPQAPAALPRSPQPGFLQPPLEAAPPAPAQDGGGSAPP